MERATIAELDKAQDRVIEAVTAAYDFATRVGWTLGPVMLESVRIGSAKQRAQAALGWAAIGDMIGRDVGKAQVECYGAMRRAQDAAYNLAVAMQRDEWSAARLKSALFECEDCLSRIAAQASR